MLFSVKPLAWMTTCMLFLTICILHVLAFLFETDIIEKFILDLFLFSKFSIAESTFPCFCMSLKFFTVFSCVIWLSLTITAEVLITSSAFYSVLSHMNTGLWWNRLTSVIFCVVVYFTCLDLHHVSTWTWNKIIISFHKLFKLWFIDFLEFFLREIIFQFLFLDHLVTFWAIKESLCHKSFKGIFLETL